MAFSKHPQKEQNDVVLPRFCCCLIWTVFVIICLAASLLLYPWDPEVEIERFMVRRVKVHPLPPLSAEVWLALTVRVKNRDVYWMELTDVDVGVKYKGFKMGHVRTEGWHVKGWGDSHVFGELEFSGFPSSHVANLMRDLAKGRVNFRAVVKVVGHYGILYHDFPSIFKTVLACEVLVNTKNHTILHQHCIQKD